MIGSTVQLLTLAACIGLLLAGCAAGQHAVSADGDAAGPRIAVMAPAAAEMLEALGMIDAIVGVGDYVTAPDALADLPKLGAYNAPNVEQVLTLETDLLITAAGEAAAPAHARLEQLGVTVLALDTSTYAGVFAALGQVGMAVGREDEADRIAGSMRADLDAIRRRSAGQSPRRVLFVVGRDPLYVAGPGSHVDEMISAVGGSNVAYDAAAPYQRLSTEAVLERLPEVIIDTSDNRPGAPRGRLAGFWGQWEFLPAVSDGRVYHVAPEHLVIPGIRLAEMTRLVGRLVRPDVFGEPATDELR